MSSEDLTGVGLERAGALRSTALHDRRLDGPHRVTGGGDDGEQPQQGHASERGAGHEVASLPQCREGHTEHGDGEGDTERAQHTGDLPERGGGLTHGDGRERHTAERERRSSRLGQGERSR